MHRIAPALCAALLAAACATTPTQGIVEQTLQSGVTAATSRFEAGDAPEAEVLLFAVEQVDPSFSGVEALRQKLGPEREQITYRGALGINRRLRSHEDANFLVRLILYAPDRAFDLLDLITLDAHVGLGAFANLHVTRRIQAGAGLRTKLGVGIHDQRNIGLLNESEAGVAVLGLGTQTVAGNAIGTSGFQNGAETMAGRHRSSDGLYQSFRDFWGIGASLTAGLVGIDFELHPVQLFDFIGGFLLFDFARDDYATSRRLHFSSIERDLLSQLADVRRSRVWESREKPTGAGAAN